MKKILIFAALFCAVSLGHASTIQTDIAEIIVPNDWQARQNSTVVLLAIDTTCEGNIITNVNLVTEELDRQYSSVEYKKAALEMFKAVMPQMKILESRDNWAMLENTYSGVLMRQLQFFYVKGKKAFVLTFTCAPDKFDDKLFRRIEKTLKLK